MTEKKLSEYLPWVAVAVLAYLFVTKQNEAPKPVDPVNPPKPSIVDATKAILPAIKAANTKIFEDAAAKVEAKQITSDKQLFEFVQPATKAAREAANKPFDVSLDLTLPRNDDGTFAGKESEVASLLLRIARAW